MNNNEAVVCRIGKIEPIPGADKIVQCDVTLDGIKVTQTIMSVDTKLNQLVVYFDSNLCLSSSLTNQYPELKKYLGKGDRVKTIKLRGIISNGLCIEIEKFFHFFGNNFEAIDFLKEGTSFVKIKDINICHKYIPQVVQVHSHNKGKIKKGAAKLREEIKIIPNQFNFHFDTTHLVKNIHKVDPNEIIIITKKLHGTSSITSYCLTNKKLSFIEKILIKLGIDINKTENDYIYASRKVIKNRTHNVHYYGEDIWTTAGQLFKNKLHKGETVYFEIVGFLSNGRAIQKDYDYGCSPNQFKIYVYRMTTTNSDGIVHQYSAEAEKERCDEMGIQYVPILYHGKAKDLFPDLDISNHWHQNFIERLRKLYLEQDCDICKNKVPAEGIVLRIDNKDIQCFKLKSDRFTLRESENKENEIADIEEQESATAEEN